MGYKGWILLILVYVFSLGCTNSTPVIKSLDWMTKEGFGSGYKISGQLKGLNYGSLTLSLIKDTKLIEKVTLSKEGSFSFIKKIENNSKYNVEISTYPSTPSMICNVIKGNGVIAKADVSNIEIECPTVQSLVFSSSGTLVPKDISTRAEIQAVFSNGLIRDVTKIASYATSDSAVLTAASGDIIAHNVGTAVVTASFAGQMAVKNFTVTSDAISSISFFPEISSLPKNTSQKFSVFATLASGQVVDVSPSSSWSSSNSATFSVTNDGKVSALNAGSGVLTVFVGAITKSRSLDVSAASLVGFEISPAIKEARPGQRIQYKGTAKFSDGSAFDVTDDVQWVSSDASRAHFSNVEGIGLLQITSVGAATINGTFLNLTSSAVLSINEQKIDSISISGPAVLPIGITSPYQIKGSYVDGTDIDLTDTVAFITEDETVIARNTNEASSNYLIGLKAGTKSISANYLGLRASLTVEVKATSLSSLKILPDDLLLPKGVNSKFSVKGTFGDGTVLDLTRAVQWTSTDSSLGSISSGFEESGAMKNLVTGNSWAAFNISASLSGVSDSVKVTVTPANLTKIVISQNNIVIAPGKSKPLKAFGVFSDQGVFEVTKVAQWTTTESSTAFVADGLVQKGRLTGLKVGSTLVKAELNGFSGSANVSVVKDAIYSSDAVGLGLTATYFSDTSFTTKVGSRIDNEINFNLGTNPAPSGFSDNFSIRWEGTVRSPSTGIYRFIFTSDDGVKVYIDDVLKINHWTPHVPMEDSFDLVLIEGQSYKIKIEYYENGGGATSILEWQSPSGTRQGIPSSQLFPK